MKPETFLGKSIYEKWEKEKNIKIRKLNIIINQ